MDINLPDILVINAARNMRDYENLYSNIHTHIVAVTMDSIRKFVY